MNTQEKISFIDKEIERFDELFDTYNSDGTPWYYRQNNLESFLRESYEKLAEELEGMKKPKTNEPVSCPDNKPGCLVYHYKEVEPPENKIYDAIITKLKEQS